MKNQVIIWLEQGCNFETGRAIFCENSINAHFKKVLMLENDRKYLEKVLYTELLNLAKITKTEAHKIQNQSTVQRIEIPSEPIIATIIPQPEAEEKFQKEYKKTVREMYPNINFNNDPKIDIIYILIGKQITSYHNYVEAHRQLRKSISHEDVIKYTKIVVENVKENKMLIDELNNYNNHNDFLYIHPYFAEINLIAELKALSHLQLSTRLTNLKTYISRYENNILNKAEDKNRGKWENHLASYRKEQELINNMLNA